MYEIIKEYVEIAWQKEEERMRQPKRSSLKVWHFRPFYCMEPCTIAEGELQSNSCHGCNETNLRQAP